MYYHFFYFEKGEVKFVINKTELQILNILKQEDAILRKTMHCFESIEPITELNMVIGYED